MSPATRSQQRCNKRRREQRKGDASRRRGPQPPAQPPRRTEHGTSCHRHYKVTARAIQRQGEETVAFRLTTPSEGSGLPSGGRYGATVLGISARPARAQVHYSVDVAVGFKNPGEALVNSYFVNTFAEGMTLAKVGEKLAGFNARVAEQWPFFRETPRAVAVAVPDRSAHYFELFLPPYTGYFTDDPHFWTVFRFPPTWVHAYFGMHGGLGARHGIRNQTNEVMTITGSEILDREYCDLLYLAASGDDRPRNTRLNVEVEFFSDWLPQTVTEAKPLEASEAAKALSLLVASGLNTLGLKDPGRVLAVEQEEIPGAVLLRSERFSPEKHPKIPQVRVRLSEPIAALFALASDREPVLEFDGDEPKTVTLTLKRQPADDVLAGHYPLHLVAAGQPGAHHFVHGIGWTTLLGVVDSPPRRCLGRTEWVELLPGQTELRLTLLDRWCKPLTPATAVTEFVLYLELVDLF